MKKNKVIGLLLMALAIATILGMAINDNAYWAVYNYLAVIISAISGFILLKQKT